MLPFYFLLHSSLNLLQPGFYTHHFALAKTNTTYDIDKPNGCFSVLILLNLSATGFFFPSKSFDINYCLIFNDNFLKFI